MQHHAKFEVLILGKLLAMEIEIWPLVVISDLQVIIVVFL